MKLLIDIARFAAWASLTLLLCVLSWLAVAMRTVPARLDGVLLRAEGVESKINASAINLDRATGAWADSAKRQAASVDALVGEARGTLAQSTAAVSELQAATLTANEQMRHIGPVLDEARVTLAAVGAQAETLGAAAKPVLEQASATERDVDALVTSADLKAMLGNMQRASGNVADGTAEAAVIVRDARGSWILRLLGFGRNGVKR